MNLQPSTQLFLRQLEQHAHKPINFPDELGALVELVGRSRSQPLFFDLIFQAKFVVKTKEVMQRIGPTGKGFDKLSSEFQASLEKVTGSLRTILNDADSRLRARVATQFLSMEQESLSRLLRFLSDLSAVKNWEVDGKRLPFDGSTESKPKEPSVSPLKHVRSALALCVLLCGALVLIDPPVTTIGWIIVILLLLLLTLSIYVISTAITLEKRIIS